MTALTNDLLRITGIGPVLAQRLAAAGLDSPAAIVAAGEAGLQGIAGFNPRNIPAILEQAATLAKEEPEHDAPTPSVQSPAPDDDLKVLISELRAAIQEIAAAARTRFPEELAGKIGHKMTRDMVAGLDALYAIEELLVRRPKRSRKALAKARKAIEGLVDGDLKALRKSIRKARKALERVTR